MSGRKKLPKRRFQLSNADYHLSSKQTEKLIMAGGSRRDKVLLRLLVETGIRRSEASNLDKADIKEAESILIIKKGKGDKLRLIPITDTLKTGLLNLTRKNKEGPLFVSRINKRLSSRQINRIVANCGKKAQIENPNPKYEQVTPHLLRHSFARLWKQRGGDIETLSKIMGHSSVSTTWDLYGKSGLQDIQRQYANIMNKTI